MRLAPGESVLGATYKRLRTTFSHLRRYRELLKFLIAFLIYNDGIGTIIGVAAIYGAELGFGTIELISAILLVQFVGIPYSLIFGRLPRAGDARRPVFLAFILFNIVALPVAGIIGARVLSPEQSGAPRDTLPPGPGLAEGEVVSLAGETRAAFVGAWEPVEISADTLGEDEPATYLYAEEPGARLEIPFSGQKLSLTHSTGPDHGIWNVVVVGAPLLEDGEPVQIDAYSSVPRYEIERQFTLEERGEHVLALENTGERNPDSAGNRLGVARVELLPPPRPSSLPLIVGLLLALEGIGLLLSFLLGPTLFGRMADTLDTKRSIFLALVAYGVIATWGYFLNSVIEFWFLAWMVAVVQGGSQALAQPLRQHTPAARSGGSSALQRDGKTRLAAAPASPCDIWHNRPGVLRDPFLYRRRLPAHAGGRGGGAAHGPRRGRRDTGRRLGEIAPALLALGFALAAPPLGLQAAFLSSATGPGWAPFLLRAQRSFQQRLEAGDGFLPVLVLAAGLPGADLHRALVADAIAEAGEDARPLPVAQAGRAVYVEAENRARGRAVGVLPAGPAAGAEAETQLALRDRQLLVNHYLIVCSHRRSFYQSVHRRYISALLTWPGEAY